MRSRLVIVCAALLLTTACSGSDGEGPSRAGSATVTTNPALVPTPDYPSTVVTYDEETGLVNGVADAELLRRAPQDFKDFLTAALERGRSSADCPEGLEITVDRLRADGWARGTVVEKECGGYRARWARVDDRTWKQVWAGQDLYDCPTLEKYRFPTDIVGTECYDAGKDDTVAYAG